MTIDRYSLLTRDLGLDSKACAGKVIVVTGAGRGIGLHAARAFGILGGKVVLAETDAEFNRLPIFVRPMARNGFKGKAGQSLTDWQRRLAALGEGEARASADLPECLEKLAGYYRDVPKETARFTRDAEMLRQVTEVCRQRIGVIERLQALVRTS